MEIKAQEDRRSNEMERLLLRVSETAQLIGLGKSKTYDLIAKGEIPAVRIGKCVRVPADKLLAWVDAQVGTNERKDAEER
jgi:excisionase family DNA binding protein